MFLRDGSLQVWAGPLEDGEVVVLLLNIGNGTVTIKADWADIGLKGKAGAKFKATDLWTGKTVATNAGGVSAAVASHDSAVLRVAVVGA